MHCENPFISNEAVQKAAIFVTGEFTLSCTPGDWLSLIAVQLAVLTLTQSKPQERPELMPTKQTIVTKNNSPLFLSS